MAQAPRQDRSRVKSPSWRMKRLVLRMGWARAVAASSWVWIRRPRGRAVRRRSAARAGEAPGSRFRSRRVE